MFREIKLREWAVLFLLVGLGIASRYWIDTPNFKPIAAFALFGGFFFRKPSLAFGAVLAMLLISDYQLGFYPLPMMVCVYLSLAISVGLGIAIGRYSKSRDIGSQNGLAFVGASLVMSTLFFLLTNAGVWWMGGLYPPTFGGLMESYVAGLPFYRWTLLGDMTFTMATIGVYATMRALLKSEAGQPATEKRAQLSHDGCPV